jgi:IMP dehydrogenase
MIRSMRGHGRYLHHSASIPTALTYDDVLLVPNYSDVTSRKTVSLRTQLSTNIWLNNPIVSSNMDTVTEDRMAMEMAKNGGIGILHRFSSLAEQVEQVRRVKRAEAFIIDDPYRIGENETVSTLQARTRELGVRSMLVVDGSERLTGIVTNRDLRFADITPATLVRDLMTPRSKLRVAVVQVPVLERR